METKGRLVDVSKSILDNRWRLTFDVESVPAVDSISGRDLRIKACVWREKRSLNANAYFHVLVGKIADVMDLSITEVKNQLIADYGQFEINEDGGCQMIILNDSIEWESVEWLHLRPTQSTKVLDDGKVYRVYRVMRGSHTYDTKEMSRLIDATVEMAKGLGIETLTPQDLERMKLQWQPR